MIVYTITRYDTGNADYVRIIPDLRVEVNAFSNRHTDCTFLPEKQCRYRTRSTGYRSGQ